MITWHEAVIEGIRRFTKRNSSVIFTRQEIISSELDQIKKEAGSSGDTPAQTLSRVLQELRDEKIIEFVDNRGKYIFLAEPIQIEDEDLPEDAIDTSILTGQLQFGEIPTGESIYAARYRKGQQRLRDLTLLNYDSQCALCDIKNQKYLVTSHLARWADAPSGRGDLRNIICLCQWHDPLLEHGLISFTNDRKLLKKSTDSHFLNMILERTNPYKYPKHHPITSEYITMHRKRTGFQKA